MTESIPVVTQLAAIQVALQFLKEKIPPEKWSDTPLPIIAAPGAWMQEVAALMGAADDEVPASIFGCGVVQKDEIDEPVMIDHDGATYKVSQFMDKPEVKTEEIMERYKGTIKTLAEN